jgi:hypothetical protein
MTSHLDIGRPVRLLASSAAGLLLVAGTAVPASAAGTSDATIPYATKGQYCTDFVNHLSRDLNVSPERLRSAAARAARSTVDDAVAKGDLTSSQGDALKKRLSNQNVCPTASGSTSGNSSGQGS